jgi:hypothetical protein
MNAAHDSPPAPLARKSFRAPASGKVRLKIHAVAPELSHPPAQPKDPHTATVTLRNAAGLSSTASKQITLQAPKRRALHPRRGAYTTVKSVDVASRP